MAKLRIRIDWSDGRYSYQPAPEAPEGPGIADVEETVIQLWHAIDMAVTAVDNQLHDLDELSRVAEVPS